MKQEKVRFIRYPSGKQSILNHITPEVKIITLEI